MNFSDLFSQKPDFAFPQTVSKNANKDLESAIKHDDAHAALNALIRLYISDYLLDNQSVPSTIAKIESTTEKFKENSLAGIFYALEANAYNNYYNSNRWTFDRRELPLTPRPEDISEWSGEMFRAKITELCKQSVANPKGLSTCKINDYSDIVTADTLTAFFYPTLLDFACSQAIAFNEDVNNAYYYELGQKYSPETLLWQTMQAKDGYGSIRERIAKLKSFYQDNCDNERCAIVLINYYEIMGSVGETNLVEIGDNFIYDDSEDEEIMARGQWMIQAIDEYDSRFPNSLLNDQLKNIQKEIKQKSAEISLPNYVYPGQEFQIKLTSRNANKVNIKIYKIPAAAYTDRYRNIQKLIEKATPYKTIAVDFTDELPFMQQKSVELTLDEVGYYAVCPDVPSTKGNNSYIDFMLCIDRMPAIFNRAINNYGVVVDPISGKPISDQQLVIRYDNTSYNAPLTNSDGISNITSAVNKTKYGNGEVWLKYGKDLYSFNGLGASLFKPNKDSNTKITAQVLTDRAIYHPGDKIQFLTIVSSLTPQYGKQPEKELIFNRQVCVKLRNANHQDIDTIFGTTDQWGRFNGEFTVPTDGLTGQFTIVVSKNDYEWGQWGSRSVIVSEYKMPDFELVDLNVAKDTPSTGCVTVSGKARMYSGMPLANAQISMILSTGSLWRWFSPDEKIWSTELTTNTDGTFAIEVPASILKEHIHDWFVAQIDATSPTGTTANASQVFTLGKQYAISIDYPNGNVDGEQPLVPKVNVYGPDGNPATIDLRWEIIKDKATVMDGTFNGVAIDISKLMPGNYDFKVAPLDSTLADSDTQEFVIFNRSTDIVPGSSAIWFEDDNAAIGADNRARINYGVKEDAYVYYAIGIADSICDLHLMHVAKGYHTLEFDLPAGCVNATIWMLTTLDFNTTARSVSLSRREESGLEIVAESFRDKLVPSSSETWKFKIVDSKGQPVEAAFAIDMYNKVLQALAPQYFNIFFPTGRQYTSFSTSFANYYDITNSFTEILSGKNYSMLVPPQFYFYGQYIPGNGYSRGMVMKSMRGSNMLYEESVDCLEAPMMAEARVANDLGYSMADEAVVTGTAIETEEAEEEKPNTAPNDNFDYRDSSMPLALWVPMLTTESDGAISYTFQVPNAVTTWRMQCIAWTKGLEVGSLLRDLVASKPVMAQANAPRFLRAGDRAIISALVMNNSEKTDTVTSVIQLFNPFSGQIIKEETITTEIDSMGSATVNIEVDADGDMSSIGYRIRSTMGSFTDGEQTIVPILTSMAQLIETEPFYLNPGETNYTTTLPSESDARISLTFSENPAWSIVSALPGLRLQISDYANSAAAALFSAALAQGIISDNPNIAKAIKEWSENPSDSMLVSMLEKNEDLKIALLNATPWVESAMSDTDRMARLVNIFDKKETDNTIKKAIEILADLQRSDGGWAWGKWCDESSEWVTSNVLEMLSDLKQANWMPNDRRLAKMTEKALIYYDKEVSTLRYGQKELYPNLLYAILRPVFSETPISAGGQKVIKITLDDIEKNWKKYSDPAYKSMAAMALYRNGRQEKGRLLMSSVSEFGVRTPSQGIRFPNMNALSSYAIVLEAFATIDPNSQYVDGLRQQLIVRKQGTDWGDAVVTSQVVAGILSCGSKWTVPAQGATVMAGDNVISPTTPIEKYTGQFKADLSQYAGEQLHIFTPGVGPAYGAVYAQFNRVMENVEPHACDDLSIVKQMTVRRGTEWEMLPDTLQVGDRVKIQLTIHCKRNLNYVTIVDERAACFEPVDQIPGWLWSEGAGFYRENRDSSTKLFIVSLRPGTYLLTYEMNVSNAGDFSSGVATIQSQYAPEISAHSQGCRLKSVQNK